jgi:hypothetical protein
MKERKLDFHCQFAMNFIQMFGWETLARPCGRIMIVD